MPNEIGLKSLERFSHTKVKVIYILDKKHIKKIPASQRCVHSAEALYKMICCNITSYSVAAGDVY